MGIIPNGYYAGRTTGNGDCLYNSVSLALFGHELCKDAIRLASVLHTIDHFDHYVQMVCPLQTCSLTVHVMCEFVSHTLNSILTCIYIHL